MKREINQLIAIAEQYVDVAKKLNCDVNEHNYIRTPFNAPSHSHSEYNVHSPDEAEIKLYFGGDFKTWSLYYGEVIQVIGFAKSLNLPFDITAKRLKEAIKDLEEYLPKFMKFEEQAEEIAENKKKAKIKSLEAQIKTLQS